MFGNEFDVQMEVARLLYANEDNKITKIDYYNLMQAFIQAGIQLNLIAETKKANVDWFVIYNALKGQPITEQSPLPSE